MSRSQTIFTFTAQNPLLLVSLWFLLNTEEAHRKLLCKCLPEATRFFYCNGKALVDSAVDPTKKRASPRL